MGHSPRAKRSPPSFTATESAASSQASRASNRRASRCASSKCPSVSSAVASPRCASRSVESAATRSAKCGRASVTPAESANDASSLTGRRGVGVAPWRCSQRIASASPTLRAASCARWTLADEAIKRRATASRPFVTATSNAVRPLSSG